MFIILLVKDTINIKTDVILFKKSKFVKVLVKNYIIVSKLKFIFFSFDFNILLFITALVKDATCPNLGSIGIILFQIFKYVYLIRLGFL